MTIWGQDIFGNGDGPASGTEIPLDQQADLRGVVQPWSVPAGTTYVTFLADGSNAGNYAIAWPGTKAPVAAPGHPGDTFDVTYSGNPLAANEAERRDSARVVTDGNVNVSVGGATNVIVTVELIKVSPT